MKRWLVCLLLAMPFYARADLYGVKGGLVVCIGVNAAEKISYHWKNPRFLFQCLEKDPAMVSSLRKTLRQNGLYGRVSVSQWNEKFLPYNNGVVNLLVATGSTEPATATEIARVLVPGGVSVIDGKRSEKPWPKDIDQWTHFLHGPDNNAVAHDRRIATPNHLRWEADPKRTRDHDALASISAMTTSNGRMFYILDEGLTSLSHQPADWKLIGRDAFNGKLLWKRKIDSWVTSLHYFRSGPTQLPRRLVSVGDQVFATLGLTAPVSLLDAATGRTLKIFQGSENAEEFIVADGKLFTVLGDPQYWNRYAPKADNYWDFVDITEKADIGKRIVVFDINTGKLLWKVDGPNLNYLTPLSMITGGGNVFYMDNRHLHCLDVKTGRERWKSEFSTEGLFVRNFTPTVVYYKDVVAVASTERTTVFSVKNGEKLWEDKGYAGFASPPDVFIIDGLLWATPITKAVHLNPKNVPGEGKYLVAFDLHTGEIKRRVDKKKVWPDGHHHRCYRNKATERFLICGRRGLEFVDITGGDGNQINWWLRGLCQYGIMPANGLIYLPPHPCRCFGNIKFDGFHAVENIKNAAPEVCGAELLKGPAFGKIRVSATQVEPSPGGVLWAAPVSAGKADEWPTYRANITRSAATDIRIAGRLKKKWSTHLKGQLTAATVADGRLFISAKDQHTLYCLDAKNGKVLWNFPAEGPVDSPPTIAGGTAFFGCRAGYVYALRTSDGALAWRFRAAPGERRTVAHDRVESIWPVNGSVLILNGTVYCAAGYSSYLDGGLRIVGLDARTGALKYERRISSDPGKQDGCMPDVLLSDGISIVMRKRRFDLTLQDFKGKEAGAVITSTTGLLDDTWGHRWTWDLAQGINGKLLAYNDETVCGVQSFYYFLKYDRTMWPPSHTGHKHQKYARYKPENFPIGTRLFAQDNLRPAKSEQEKAGSKTEKKLRKKKSSAGKHPLANHNHKWDRALPFQFRTLVLTDGLIVGAGWKDSVKIMELEPAGGEGSELMLIDPADGEILKKTPIDAEPVFDGMAVAYGNIYLPLKNGRIECWE